MSGNLDAPEGGFDAIMQVVACKVRTTDYILRDFSVRCDHQVALAKIRKNHKPPLEPTSRTSQHRCYFQESTN